MKGKKVDTEFLSLFIEKCVQQEYLTPEEIVIQAQQEIEQINIKIIESEHLRVRRSKLLDVISTFQRPIKISKIEEAKLIPFFQFQHPDICKFICDLLKFSPCTKEQLSHKQYLPYDLNFCIKQLLEHKVITKIGDSFLRGDAFEEYLKFVLREV
jgi:hypothetical protein